MTDAETARRAIRRAILWNKNNEEGLTDREIIEYRKLTQSVNRYIKCKHPESWERIKYLGRCKRIRFNRVAG